MQSRALLLAQQRQEPLLNECATIDYGEREVTGLEQIPELALHAFVLQSKKDKDAV